MCASAMGGRERAGPSARARTCVCVRRKLLAGGPPLPPSPGAPDARLRAPNSGKRTLLDVLARGSLAEALQELPLRAAAPSRLHDGRHLTGRRATARKRVARTFAVTAPLCEPRRAL